MRLADAVARGSILRNVEGGSPEEIVRAMLARTESLEGVDRDHVLELVLAREHLASTHVGEGVAIPHPNTRDIEGLGGSTVILATPRKPVNWAPAGEDPAKVDIVALVLAADQQAHLQLIAQLARKLRDSAFAEMLRRNAKVSAIVAALETEA